jgi:hypothetical protein
MSTKISAAIAMTLAILGVAAALLVTTAHTPTGAPNQVTSVR